ncbi:MAG: hypothetical protein EOO38_11170, partial [Cytophagaceae bacterium]
MPKPDGTTRIDHQLLRYKDGSFTFVEAPAGPVVSIARSPRGQLYVTDGEAIHRRDGEGWTLVGRFDWPSPYVSLLVDEQGGMWAGAMQRLREGPSLAMTPGCATPFVYLYDASDKNPSTFNYPSTRKALAGFAEADSLGLVEFTASGARRVGVK